MGEQTDQWYRDRARAKWHRDGSIEIDNNAAVSNGADSGAYVSAWVWAEDPGTDEEDE